MFVCFLEDYTKSVPSQLMSIIRQIVDRFSNSHRKLAVKFGQAGFLTLMVRDLKILKQYIKKSVDDGVSERFVVVVSGGGDVVLVVVVVSKSLNSTSRKVWMMG